MDRTSNFSAELHPKRWNHSLVLDHSDELRRDLHGYGEASLRQIADSYSVTGWRAMDRGELIESIRARLG